MINYEGQEKLFEAIGKKLKRKTEAYIIGGSAMLFYNAKVATRDIDIVTGSKADFEGLKKALEEMGFYKKPPFINAKYGKLDVEKPVFFELGDRRIDLFMKKIICFELSETIASRVMEAHEYGNLTVKIVSPEDIILLKCATERAGDRQDAKELIERYNIKWDVVIKEAENQSKIGGDLFVVYLFDFIEELKEDFGADIPREVIKKVMKIGEKAMIDLMKKKAKTRK